MAERLVKDECSPDQKMDDSDMVASGTTDLHEFDEDKLSQKLQTSSISSKGSGKATTQADLLKEFTEMLRQEDKSYVWSKDLIQGDKIGHDIVIMPDNKKDGCRDWEKQLQAFEKIKFRNSEFKNKMDKFITEEQYKEQYYEEWTKLWIKNFEKTKILLIDRVFKEDGCKFFAEERHIKPWREPWNEFRNIIYDVFEVLLKLKAEKKKNIKSRLHIFILARVFQQNIHLTLFYEVCALADGLRKEFEAMHSNVKVTTVTPHKVAIMSSHSIPASELTEGAENKNYIKCPRQDYEQAMNSVRLHPCEIHHIFLECTHAKKKDERDKGQTTMK